MMRQSLTFAWAVALAALLLAGIEKVLIATGHKTMQMINDLGAAGGIILVWAAIIVLLQHAGKNPDLWRRTMSREDDDAE